MVKDTLVWLEDHSAAEKDDHENKQKAVEQMANPILKKDYESAGEAVTKAWTMTLSEKMCRRR